MIDNRIAVGAGAGRRGFVACHVAKTGRFMKMNLSSRCTVAALLVSLVCAASGAIAQDSTPAPAKTAPVQPAAAAKPVKLPPMAPKAGTISGRVVNEMGAPVPRFTIKYWGYQQGVVINQGAENLVAETQGSGGAYSIKVPPGTTARRLG